MKVAVLGVTGMLGSTLFRLLSREGNLTVVGTARSAGAKRYFAEPLRANVMPSVEAGDPDALASFFQAVRPNVVINAIGLVKQLAQSKDPLIALPINAILPHRLVRLSDLVGARLIHVSTDCVFSGRKGGYTETDLPDAEDLYGRSKLLGEVDYPNAVTLRTSIIGRELATQNGLVDWFLAQEGSVSGYTNAIFSGLTTDELTRVILRHVLPNPDLRGIYHVSVAPIDKCSLLRLVRNEYGLDTSIEPDGGLAIDRSLNSARFRAATKYVPPAWPTLIAQMRNSQHIGLADEVAHV